ncbi:MAG: type II secretion system protein M [Desulfobacula sp.]|nr:type II secretion system protein M [Desulfobacula sp.]
MDTKLQLFGRQLNPREQLSIGVAGGVIVLFIIFQLIIMPLIHKRSKLIRTIASKQQSLGEMVILKSQYDEFNNKAGKFNTRLKNRPKDFTLFSFLDELAGKAGIKENISSMKPKTISQAGSIFKKSVVEMKLQGITTEQLATYLHGVEASKNMVYVKRVSVSKKGIKDENISAVLQVETIES